MLMSLKSGGINPQHLAWADRDVVDNESHGMETESAFCDELDREDANATSFTALIFRLADSRCGGSSSSRGRPYGRAKDVPG